jgi:micrococcal nuclease
MIGLVLRAARLALPLLTVMALWHLLPSPLRAAASDAAKRGLQAAGFDSPASNSTAHVVKVVDGDTLRVRLADGTQTRVRLLLADAPEHSALRASTGHHVDCGGTAALNYLRTLVRAGDRVTLTRDPTQDATDKYGRRLAYVSHEGTDLAKAMIGTGWAKVYVYDRPGLRVLAYQAAAVSARVHHRGVYAACGGDFHRAAS